MARSHLLVLLVLLTGACTADPAAPPPSSRTPQKPPTLINEVVPPQNVLTVVRDVIDGRTVELADGSRVRISLLAAPAACWSESALTFARTTLLARSVRFTGLTPGEVHMELEDGTDYAVLAVQQGALRPEGVDGGPLINAEAEASAAKRGLWGPPCNGSATSKPSPSQALTMPSSPATPSSPAAPTTTTPPPPPPPPPARGCAVAYRITGQWNGGFQANVTVRNTGTKTANGWTLRWNFAAGESVREMWNASARQFGATVSAVNVGYNPQIAPGGSVQVGFNGNSRGPHSAPTAFTFNGEQCSVE
ncbi:cellulose binding domain-containing protein [Lentzea atacamensis]|uniref:Cellulose binding domain-containing protein n=1 Tax=Lentzea atacamensis TaxID=531938 RepID=A0A316I7C1_9PSEU|nr:cellulose binding domain-containing protein [Lentzea atacamensis]PWK88397.1 cellulose binding domain-containing protein [Lentzea atacamensis]RAS70870.1 cellulose binding domain-containing protein [Lentzea atacamensis]